MLTLKNKCWELFLVGHAFMKFSLGNVETGHKPLGTVLTYLHSTNCISESDHDIA